MKFEYKDIDEEGLIILNTLSGANKLNEWMYDTISVYCKGEILEIGSGVGNISQYFIKNNREIFLSDIRLNYRNIVKVKFNLDEERILDIDIIHPDFENVYSDLLEKFDTVYCLNVLEHIKDDDLAIQNMVKFLKPKGRLITLVPAFQCLYNRIDLSLGHYKRYNKKSLKSLMFNYGDVIECRYFNFAGIFGWFISGKLLKENTIKREKINLYDFFVPIFRLVDKIFYRIAGLSVLCVIEKNK